MKQEITKTIVRVGNSAGVILPKEWINGKAKIQLVEKPLNIRKDILEILNSYLENILGIYLTGSYARGEQTEKSDVDVLVITSGINKNLHKGKYNIILVDKKEVERQLKENALPLLPMIREARPIVNSELIKKYKKQKLTKKNLDWQIKTTKSALKMIEKSIQINQEIGEKYLDSSLVYSLILRLRTLIIIENIKTNEKPSNKQLKKLIEKTVGNKKSYEVYLDAKKADKKTQKQKISLEDAEKIKEEVQKKLEKIEKWLKEQKE